MDRLPYQRLLLVSRVGWGIVVCAVMVCGCTPLREYWDNGLKVGPDYLRPVPEVNGEWIDADSEQIRSESPAEVDWWERFNDPVLGELVSRAYDQNLPLREAGFRVLASRAAYNIAVGGFFPQSQSSVSSFNRYQISDSLSTVPALQGQAFSIWQTGFNLSWELDLWGKIRRGIESSAATYQASVEEYDGVLVTLIADVAERYTQVRIAQKQVADLRRLAAIQRASLQLATDRFEGGATGELDVSQARLKLAQTAMPNALRFLLLAPLIMLGVVAAAADIPYSMPATGPAYPSPPWRYRDCRILVLTLRSDPEVVKRLVPPPLVPNADGVVMMWLGDMHAIEPFELDYLEYGLGVPVEHDGKPGIYCTHLYLDDDTAIAGGREIWGWPKKLAAMAFTVEGNRVTATATRKGVEIIRAEFEGGSDLPIEDLPQHFINFKIIPSVRADAPPDVCQLNDCPMLRQTRSQQVGKATLALRSSAVDALGELPVHEILQARFSIADVELPLGETIHDYLAEPGSDDAGTR